MSLFGPSLPIVAAALLLTGPLRGQEPQTTWTITVDCLAGQSINAALAQAAPELTVEVRGECREDVVVRRDNVTLRGVDPLRDGIRSSGTGDSSESTVLIRDARRVRIENLRLSGGLRDGLRVMNSHDEIVVTNSRLESNGVWGASVADSTVEIRDSVFVGNAQLVVDTAGGGLGGGLMVARGSDVLCSNCTLELNPEAGTNLGAVSFAGSTLRLNGSRVSGDTAVLAQSYSRALLDSTELTGATWAFQANQYGTVRMLEGTLSGPFLGKGYSTVELLGATQVLNQLQNFVTESSSLIGDRRAVGEADTTLAGLTLVADYSNGRLVNGTAVESLICGLGGDVFCDGTVLRPDATGCKSCP